MDSLCSSIWTAVLGNAEADTGCEEACACAPAGPNFNSQHNHRVRVLLNTPYEWLLEEVAIQFCSGAMAQLQLVAGTTLVSVTFQLWMKV